MYCQYMFYVKRPISGHAVVYLDLVSVFADLQTFAKIHQDFDDNGNMTF